MQYLGLAEADQVRPIVLIRYLEERSRDEPHSDIHPSASFISHRQSEKSKIQLIMLTGSYKYHYCYF